MNEDEVKVLQMKEKALNKALDTLACTLSLNFHTIDEVIRYHVKDGGILEDWKEIQMALGVWKAAQREFSQALFPR
jgi:hypothetical protein